MLHFKGSDTLLQLTCLSILKSILLRTAEPNMLARLARLRCASSCRQSVGLCCKSRFALMIKNSAGYRRGFRVKM